jgi:hypothetical protein
VLGTAAAGLELRAVCCGSCALSSCTCWDVLSALQNVLLRKFTTDAEAIEEDGGVDDSHFEVTTEGAGLYRVVGAKIEKVSADLKLWTTILNLD